MEPTIEKILGYLEKDNEFQKSIILQYCKNNSLSMVRNNKNSSLYFKDLYGNYYPYKQCEECDVFCQSTSYQTCCSSCRKKFCDLCTIFRDCTVCGKNKICHQCLCPFGDFLICTGCLPKIKQIISISKNMDLSQLNK